MQGMDPRDERRVRFAADLFWRDFWTILWPLGITKQETVQEAWTCYLEQKQRSQKNPHKFLRYKLLTWMTQCTKYNARAKDPSPTCKMVSCDDMKWVVAQEVVDVVQRCDVGLVKKRAKQAGSITETIVTLYLEDWTLKEISQTIGISIQAVSARMKRLAKPMAVAACMTMCLIGASRGAWAQVPVEIVGCQSVSWQANTEPDLQGYLLKRTDTTVSASTTVPIDKTITSLDCSQWPLVINHVYEWSLASVDTSLNQSAWSTITFKVVATDIVPPGAVMLFCGTMTGPDGQPKKICAVEIP